jgi:hypothetical protein
MRVPGVQTGSVGPQPLPRPRESLSANPHGDDDRRSVINHRRRLHLLPSTERLDHLATDDDRQQGDRIVQMALVAADCADPARNRRHHFPGGVLEGPHLRTCASHPKTSSPARAL